MQKGMTVYIFKNPTFAFCSNDGISQHFDKALWVGGDVQAPQLFEGDGLPRILLVKGNLPGTIKAVPVDMPAGKSGPMMGGAYIACSDSRFSEACEKIAGGRFYGAVALHDRFE